ncbi:arsenate reductase (glutaredoxin) [Tropicibacter naphthalenivorans]|uniref:Arsenate reductase n=1 Tax=Tropicibacter naphthalenivorans TaxID=441103 RepID=A0A0P1G0B8_9RHOB|nr:arsenate reductase (glutaredoxin) [Tropicibacter naphthalenivorans]CUH75142.1 Arsenate reductase [Tropicibacter naphthalenivorans]SMC46024.1 arsenate reductase [Tropicibacter naphthalenivorans]
MILWHNPRCSKSRAALALLEERGVQVTVRKYLEDAPTVEELQAAQTALGLPVTQMMRTKEAAFKDMGLTKDTPKDALLAAMAQEPKLIERPVLFKADKAVIGRPPERVLELL